MFLLHIVNVLIKVFPVLNILNYFYLLSPIWPVIKILQKMTNMITSYTLEVYKYNTIRSVLVLRFVLRFPFS